MNASERVIVSLLTGIATGAFLGCFYGWYLLSLNADNMNSNLLDFFVTKTWMMGISIAGFVSIVTYYSGWILEKINEPSETKTIILDSNES